MKHHKGMRPHDIVILLKIALQGETKWYIKDLAHELKISQSEVSESLNRSIIAGLISSDKSIIMRSSLLEFLRYGLPYVYPQRPGAIVRGIPTSHSVMPLKNEIKSNIIYVWPYAYGDMRGQRIEPLHPRVPEACLEDSQLYEVLALGDAMRVGKMREKELAFSFLKERI